MMMGMTELATVDQLRAQANDIAVHNPPLRVLDTVILGVCFALGWVFGVCWRWPVSYIVFMGLTIKHGFRTANPVKPDLSGVPNPDHPRSQRKVWGAGGAIAYSDPE